MVGSPIEVRAVLTDDVYTARSPYVAEFRTIGQVAPQSWARYTRLEFPIIDDRDYFIEVFHDSDLAADGTGTYHTSWKPWGLDKPARHGVVRVTTIEGYWDVQPGSDAGHSKVTYYLLCDPGGALPAWIINLSNKRVIPNVFRALQSEVLRRHPATPPTCSNSARWRAHGVAGFGAALSSPSGICSDEVGSSIIESSGVEGAERPEDLFSGSGGTRIGTAPIASLSSLGVAMLVMATMPMPARGHSQTMARKPSVMPLCHTTTPRFSLRTRNQLAPVVSFPGRTGPAVRCDSRTVARLAGPLSGSSRGGQALSSKVTNFDRSLTDELRPPMASEAPNIHGSREGRQVNPAPASGSSKW